MDSGRGLGQKYPLSLGKINGFEQIPFSAKIRRPDRASAPSNQTTPRVMANSPSGRLHRMRRARSEATRRFK